MDSVWLLLCTIAKLVFTIIWLMLVVIFRTGKCAVRTAAWVIVKCARFVGIRRKRIHFALMGETQGLVEETTGPIAPWRLVREGLDPEKYRGNYPVLRTHVPPVTTPQPRLVCRSFRATGTGRQVRGRPGAGEIVLRGSTKYRSFAALH
uniref:Secreted protein n=1 Tax=Mesocestoides corti TaxID=53468 RepID=A0A5K3FDK5_MESCO